MIDDPGWALEGRRLSREMYRKHEAPSSEVSIRLAASSEKLIDEKFKREVDVYELTDKDFAEDKSICVIGAGENAFAAGAKAAGKKAFIMGVDPFAKRYHTLDPAIINHDARELGFPSDFEGFDLVLSTHAVPKYFILWAAPEEHKDEIISEGSDAFDYTIADREASNEEIEDASYQAMSEMLRITKPGGKVKMYPLWIARQGMPTFDEYIMNQVVERLRADYPGLEAEFVSAERERKTEGGLIIPIPPSDRERVSLVLTRPTGEADAH